MKTTFNKKYILENRGCYTKNEVENIPFNEKQEITINALLDLLPIKDFCWFICTACQLTKLEIQLFALQNATYVLPIYENYYPNDKRVRDCVEYTKLFLQGNGNVDTLRIKICGATAAYDDAVADLAEAKAAASAVTHAANAACATVYTDWAFDATVYAYNATAANANDDVNDAYKEMLRVFICKTLLNQ